jgi:hypothetical protein
MVRLIEESVENVPGPLPAWPCPARIPCPAQPGPREPGMTTTTTDVTTIEPLTHRQAMRRQPRQLERTLAATDARRCKVERAD